MNDEKLPWWQTIISIVLFSLGTACFSWAAFIIWESQQPLPAGQHHCGTPLLAVPLLELLAVVFLLASLFAMYRD